MSKMNTIQENPAEKLELLARAKELGIKIHPATGVEKIKAKITEFLESNNETPPIIPPITPSEPDNNSGELGHADSFTYAKYNSMDELNQIRVKFKQDIKDLEKTELKKPTWEQRRKLRGTIAILNQHIAWATKRFYEIRADINKKAKAAGISQKVRKQAYLVKLVKEGKSLTTIITMSEGIKKSELVELITPEIEKECIKYRKDFSEYFARWQKKYLTSGK